MTCNNFIHTGLCADGFCRALIVSGQHHHADAHVLQFFHGTRTVFLDDIGHRDHTKKLPVPAEIQRSLSSFCQLICRFPDLTGYGCNAADKGEVSAAEFAALVNGRKAIDYRVTLWFILSKVT